MSEVDRLSNSGLYPALPIADRQHGQGNSSGQPPPDPRPQQSESLAAEPLHCELPRPPKFIIDEYA